MDFKSAITLEGYLDKQSPNIISIFQKRYFTYRFKGQFLVWFKRKPSAVTDEPKGFIKLLDVKSVVPLENDQQQFQIIYPERTFLLRAENRIVRDRWVESINAVRTYLLRLTKSIQNKDEMDRLDRMQAWRWDKAKDEEVRLIRLENQLLILNEGEDSMQLQNSRKFLTELIGREIDNEHEKNVVYGFLNRKATLRSQTRWYFICSQFNLYDQGDEDPYEIDSLLQTFDDALNKTLKQKKQESSSDSDSQDGRNKIENLISIKINSIYEFDIKTKRILQVLPVIDILSIIKNTNEVPFNMILKYLVFNKGQQQDKLYFKEEQKDINLLTNYQTQITKWSQAISIVTKRYNLLSERQKMLEERYVRYKIKMFRTKKDQQWRMIGTEAKPEYVYLNRDQFKVGGITFLLEKVTGSLKHQKVTLDEDQDQQYIGCSIPVENEKITIIFHAHDDEKDFRKKARKFIKKLEPYLAEKKQKQIKVATEQADVSTYFLDKKMRQSSASIRVNFYAMMEQQNSVPYSPQSPPKQKSFFDKFLSMFCGGPSENSLDL